MRLALEILFMLTREPMSLSEIADRLGVQRQLVHYHLKSLMDSGWVTRTKSGRVFKYITNIKKLLEKINSSPSNATTLEIARAQFIERLCIELMKKSNIVDSNDEVLYLKFLKLKLLIYSTLLHAICITDPLYSNSSSIFLRKIGALLAKYMLLELKSIKMHHLNLEAVKELFEKILDAEIKLIKLRQGNLLLHFDKFLNISLFDQKIDDVILAFTKTWFSQTMGREIHVERYPATTFRRHYSYLIKKIAIGT